MFEFLAGFIVGINVGLGVWSLLRMASIQQAPDASERELGVQGPARATSDPATRDPPTSDPPRSDPPTSDPDWAWAT